MKQTLHDISQPLLAIAAYADTASNHAHKQAGSDPVITECIDAICKEVNRASLLLKELRGDELLDD